MCFAQLGDQRSRNRPIARRSSEMNTWWRYSRRQPRTTAAQYSRRDFDAFVSGLCSHTIPWDCGAWRGMPEHAARYYPEFDGWTDYWRNSRPPYSAGLPRSYSGCKQGGFGGSLQTENVNRFVFGVLPFRVWCYISLFLSTFLQRFNYFQTSDALFFFFSSPEQSWRKTHSNWESEKKTSPGKISRGSNMKQPPRVFHVLRGVGLHGTRFGRTWRQRRMEWRGQK